MQGREEPKREALRKPGVCEAKHTQITNKACAREKGAKKKALHKPGVCEAKHTDMINKRCAKGDKNRAKQPNRPKRNIGVQKMK